ncbi:hypothetical protein JCM14202_3416 [Agrilactobacillus composti DSM 18527 = JCM 14202]|uniref:hypothetical protein n=1 Tax=Agrilactobacillus composti TaxID=398555 RepID=UPI00042E13BC|nr:hypothetical protein [Agrilactobacillus composti]GAF41474.1 hypothetical protein JCM14202_3416 [Agrilactobacillus composti DSM 18527 = JCM 14202]
MDNQTLFEELGELAQQPVLWFARQRYQTDRSNHLPIMGAACCGSWWRPTIP